MKVLLFIFIFFFIACSPQTEQTKEEKVEWVSPRLELNMQQMPITTIPFAISEKGHVKLVIINYFDTEVATLIDQFMEAGVHNITWNATDRSGKQVPSGIYIYKLFTEKGTYARQMLLVR